MDEANAHFHVVGVPRMEVVAQRQLLHLVQDKVGSVHPLSELNEEALECLVRNIFVVAFDLKQAIK